PSSRPRVGAWAGLAMLLAACATTAPARPPAAPAPIAAAAPARAAIPDVTFRAGPPPRGAVGVTASIVAPAVIAARLDALAALAGPGATLRAEVYEALGSALEILRLPPGTLDTLDGRMPIGSVFLAQGLGVTSAFCTGATFKDGAAARAALDRLGVELARLGPESTRRLPSGPIIYAGVHGRTLLV